MPDGKMVSHTSEPDVGGLSRVDGTRHRAAACTGLQKPADLGATASHSVSPHRDALFLHGQQALPRASRTASSGAGKCCKERGGSAGISATDTREKLEQEELAQRCVFDFRPGNTSVFSYCLVMFWSDQGLCESHALPGRRGSREEGETGHLTQTDQRGALPAVEPFQKGLNDLVGVC
ncbi:uncharacterized protein AAGF69_007123 isoform 1-T1 [Amazona ochrocephala]